MSRPVQILARSLAAALLLSFLTSGVGAEENDIFGVTPHPPSVEGTDRVSFNIPRETGATFEDAIRVFNKTDEAITVAIYAADAETGENETITIGLRGSRPRGIASWIDLSRSEAEIGPRGEVVVNLRIQVQSAAPVPDLGAIVVENISAGLASTASERLYLRVHSVAPNTETTSSRVRPLALQSPWLMLAIAGLVATVALIVIGAIRARRPKDIVVAPGAIEDAEAPSDDTDSHRPALRRLGSELEDDGEVDDHTDTDEALAPDRLREASSRLARTPAAKSRTRGRRAESNSEDDRPILEDDLLAEVSSPRTKRRTPRTLGPLEELDDSEDENLEEEPDEEPADVSTSRPRARTARRASSGSRTSHTRKQSSARKGSPAKRKSSPRKKPAEPQVDDFIPLGDL